MDIRRHARASCAALALLLGTPLELSAQTAPPCALCTTTVIAWQSTRDGNSEIYIGAPDATGVRRLTSSTARDEFPAVSPDGRRVAFTSDRTGAAALHIVNADGSGLVHVPAAVEHAFTPAWSADGTMLAFTGFSAGNLDIYVVRPDGSGLRRLTTSPAADLSPSWSPDGTQILFHSDRTGDNEIYAVNLLTLQERRLTGHPADDGSAAWSPDGHAIVFSSNRAGPFDWNLYVMNADGSGVTQLTGGTAIDSAPSWSPDGTQVVFERFADATSNTPDLYRIQRDGTGLVRVTQTGKDRAPSWGPRFVPGTNVVQPSVDIQLRYRDSTWLADGPPSATGAAHWIEGDLVRPGSNTLSLDLGRIEDSALVRELLPGVFELRLMYGPQRETSRDIQVAELRPRVAVQVVANTAGAVQVDLSEAMGVLRGTVTVNGGAPGAGLSMCFGRQGEYQWCTELPATGQYAVLLPRGRGTGSICASQLVFRDGCEAPLPNRRVEAVPLYAAFDYDVKPRTTTTASPIAFKAALVQLELMYKDRGATGDARPLSATGAMHWIEGDLAIRGTDTLALDVGRMGDSTLVDELDPGAYDLRLTYGPQPEDRRINGGPARLQDAFELTSSRVPVTIVGDSNRRTVVDLSATMGILRGVVSVNGDSPAGPMSLCVERKGDYRWCTELPASGEFSLLLPRGAGAGAVCSTELLGALGCEPPGRAQPDALYRAFTYSVAAGEGRSLGPISFRQAVLEIELRYKDRTWSQAVPLSATNTLHWIEGDVMRGSRFIARDLGHMGDSSIVEGIAAGTYDLRLLYGPQPRMSARFELERVPITLVADTTGSAVVDLSTAMGIITGAVNLNGGPPGEGFSVCFERRGDYLWCTALPGSGHFAALLPAGAVRGTICPAETVTSVGCDSTVRAPRGTTPPLNLFFDANVRAERTEDVTMDIRAR